MFRPFCEMLHRFSKTKPRSLHQKMWVENLCETFDMNYGERLEEAFDKNEIGIKLMHIYGQLYAFHSTKNKNMISWQNRGNHVIKTIIKWNSSN